MEDLHIPSIMHTLNGHKVEYTLIRHLKDNFVLVYAQDRLAVAERIKWTDDLPVREIKSILDVIGLEDYL